MSGEMTDDGLKFPSNAFNEPDTGYSNGKSILRDKSYSFALEMIRLCRVLQKNQNDFVLSKQVLRSGTAIGAALEEATQAESKADFVHKLSIASKEANETRYWLFLLRDSQMISKNDALKCIGEIEEIIKMLISSIKTLKHKKL